MMEMDQKMEVEKRKREGGGQGGQKKNKVVIGGAAPVEEEVNEFFAIIRRMRTAKAYFGAGRKRKDGDSGVVHSRFAFEMKDFEAMGGDVFDEGLSKKESPESCMGNEGWPTGRVELKFDLNRHPESEADPTHRGHSNGEIG